MRLAYFYDLPFPAPLAAPIQILNTCHAAAELGADVTVYVRRLAVRDEEACLAFYGLAPNAGLRIVPLGGRWSSGWSRRRLRRAVEQACAGDGPGAVLSRGVSAARVARELSDASLPRAWRFVLELHHLRLDAWTRVAVAAADGLLCVNRGLSKEVERAFGDSRPMLVLPSGTRIPPDPPAAGVRDVDVLFAGKLREGQGVHLAVEAMAFLPGRRLLVLGGAPGEVRALSGLARRVGVADRVTLSGFVPPAQVPPFLARSRVGVCPYLSATRAGSEYHLDLPGGSLKLLELMANGVPAVAADVPFVRELVTHGREAWLVEPDSPEALAKGVRTLLDDPGLVERLTTAARARAAAFSWERRAARLLDFLGSVEPRPV